MNLNIQQRLLLISVIPLMVLLGIWFWAYWIANEAEFLVKESQQSLENAMVVRDMNREVIQIQQWLTDISATRGQDGLDDGFDEAKKNFDLFKQDSEKLKSHYKKQNNQKMIEEITELQKAVGRYYDVGKVMARAYISGGAASGNQTMESFDQASAAVQKSLTPILRSQVGDARNSTGAVFTAIHQFSTNLTWMLVGAAVGIFVLSFLIGRGIINAIGAVSHKISEMVSGDADLQQRIVANRNDEIGELTDMFNLFLDKLQGSVEKIINLSMFTTGLIEHVGEGMEEIYQSGDQLAAGSANVGGHAKQVSGNVHTLADLVGQAKENADKIESLAEDMSHSMGTVAAGAEQSSVNMSNIADNAAQISDQLETGVVGPVAAFVVAMKGIASQTTQASEISQGVLNGVEETERSLHSLVELSSRIDLVIQSIDAVSSQINMLALNATIEAAGAGAAGKGFAVVASEVKGLSLKTREANSEIGKQMAEIKKLIGVCQGRNNQVSNQVVAMAKISSDISSVVIEQNQQATQIDQAVEQISEAVRQSAVSVQEATLGIKEITESAARSSVSTKETTVMISHAKQMIGSISSSSQEVGVSMGHITSSIEEMEALIQGNTSLTYLELNQSKRLIKISMDLNHTIGSFSRDADRIICWDDNLSIGNEKLDNQHKAILEQVNLYNKVATESDDIQVHSVELDRLVILTKEHFHGEAALINELALVDSSAHLEAHALILKSLAGYQESYRNNRPLDSREVFETIKKWVMNDLLVLDSDLIQRS